MNVTVFTLPEINHFRNFCNFTQCESELFELRLKEKTLEECAELMHVSISTAKRISKRVNSKIIKVC